jgi:hypothetical protein
LIVFGVVLGNDLVENADVEILAIAVVVNGCGCCMCDVYNIGILHSHPGGQHSSVAASEHHDWAVSAVGLLDELDELDKVHHGLLCGEVNEVVFGGGGLLVAEGPALTEVAVFGVEEKAVELFGDVVVVPAGVAVEHLDGALVAAVHEDGAFGGSGPVGEVNEVALLPCFAGVFEVEMGYFLGVVELLV